MTTKNIKVGKYIDWSTYVDCGIVELTKTDSKIEFREGRRHYSRVAWKAEDGSTWVYMYGQFNELDTENYYAGAVLDNKCRFGREAA